MATGAISAIITNTALQINIARSVPAVLSANINMVC